MTVLRFDNVSKLYSGGRQALREVSFEVGEGEMLFVTGHSGAGKTTLLKLIHLAERPSRGAVLFGEKNLLRVRGRKVAMHRRQVGVVFQDHRLLADRNVRLAREAGALATLPGALVFLSANTLYWQVELGPSPSGTPDRLLTCRKRRGPGKPVLWREIDRPEQRLVGIQYAGRVPEPLHHRGPCREGTRCLHPRRSFGREGAGCARALRDRLRPASVLPPLRPAPGRAGVPRPRGGPVPRRSESRFAGVRSQVAGEEPGREGDLLHRYGGVVAGVGVEALVD